MELEERTTPDGETVHVARREIERGTEGPFFAVYADPGADRPWGYVCGNCGSFSNAMDTMGRIVCNDCPNVRKPSEWDNAHE